jgi:hypothetical protein
MNIDDDALNNITHFTTNVKSSRISTLLDIETFVAALPAVFHPFAASTSVSVSVCAANHPITFVRIGDRCTAEGLYVTPYTRVVIVAVTKNSSGKTA